MDEVVRGLVLFLPCSGVWLVLWPQPALDVERGLPLLCDCHCPGRGSSAVWLLEYWRQNCFLAPVLIGGAAEAGLRDSRWKEAALSSRSGALPKDVLCRARSLSCELAECAVTSAALMSPDCGSAGVGAGDPQVFSPGLLARVHWGQAPGL